MSSIINTYLSEFKCPVCLDFVSPPINQCVTGHIICNVCFVKIDKCPTCRAAKDSIRAHFLEKLYYVFTFPCKYAEEGCRFTSKGEFLKKHQFQCVFRARRCPLSPIVECFWSGSVDKIFKHCELQHPQSSRKGSKQSFTVKNFNQISKQTVFFDVIQAHGEVFQLGKCVFPDGHMLWRFILIGLEEDLERYACKVSLGKSSKCILLGSSVIVENQDIFESECCVITPEKTVKEICDENDGDFVYDVRIIDRGFELFLNQAIHLKL